MTVTSANYATVMVVNSKDNTSRTFKIDSYFYNRLDMQSLIFTNKPAIPGGGRDANGNYYTTYEKPKAGYDFNSNANNQSFKVVMEDSIYKKFISFLSEIANAFRSNETDKSGNDTVIDEKDFEALKTKTKRLNIYDSVDNFDGEVSIEDKKNNFILRACK